VDVLVVGRARELLLVEQGGEAWDEHWYALVSQDNCEVRR